MVDLVMTSGGQISTLREFHDSGKLRTEISAEGENVTIIELPDKKTSYIIMQGQGMYMESPLREAPGKTDSGRADTGQAKEVPKMEPWGAETIKGQVCDKFKMSSGGKVAYLWLRQGTQLPVRLQDETTLLEWTKYREGAQDANLFEPPSGYHEFKMPAMAGGPMNGMMKEMTAGMPGQGLDGMRIFVKEGSPFETGGTGMVSQGLAHRALGEGRNRATHFGGQIGGKIGLTAGGPLGMIAGQFLGEAVAGYLFDKGQQMLIPGR